MAAPVAVRLEGGAKLRRALRDADGALDDLRDLHRRIGLTVQAAAGGIVPRRSGDLAGSIRSSGTKTSAVVRAGYASIPYAGVIEWGWPARSIDPQPYLTEAAQRTEPEWVGDYQREMQSILDRVAGAADGSGS